MVEKIINNVKKRFLIIILLVIALFLGGWLWWINAISAVNPSNKETQIFMVEKGESIRNIATRLKNAKLIKDQVGFFIMVKLQRYDNRLEAGTFRLNPAMNVSQIIAELTHGTLDVWVTTLEGWRNEEIADKLNADLNIPREEFLAQATEGYMFPDSYLFPKDASTGAVIKIIENNFHNRVTDEIKQGIYKQNLSLDQGIILASIVEREGRTDADRPIIAGILLKRLQNDWPLQADATLQYALGYSAQEKSWWRKNISDLDKKTASPYNTYLQTGLPPTPICNPGLASIKAVTNPTQTDYWYYLHDQDGVARFAKTLSEHNANVGKYIK